MDFEAPPPFTGALEEPPDVDSDIRIPADDDEDVSSISVEVPLDLPCSSSTTGSPQIPPVSKSRSLEAYSESCTDGTSGEQSSDRWNEMQPSADLDSTTVSQEHESSRIDGLFVKASDPLACHEDTKKDTLSTTEPVNTSDFAIQAEECDDFDDFGDFAGVDAEDSETTEPGPSLKGKIDQAFKDWNASSRRTIQNDQQTIKETAHNVGWTAFDASDEGWSADFGNFGSASSMQEQATVSQPTAQESSQESFEIVSPVLEDLCDELDLWNVESEIGGDEASNISAMFDADNPSKGESNVAPFYRGFDLWLALRIVEDAVALKFEWKGSEHGENLLRTLKVDSKAVGRGSLPSLSTSTILEPTPFITNGTSRRSVIISREEGAHGAKVLKAASPSNSLQPNNASTVESPFIPHADFDWDKSGLTNPTKAANRFSALLDVDYFSASSGGGSASTISTLQKELDQLGLLNSSAEELNMAASQPSMLDVLLASKSDGKVNRPPSELSLDARALHDQLPDIEFLRANMIMFPLSGTRCTLR